MTTKPATRPPTKPPVPASESGDNHRNEVILAGELAAPPQARVMPSGDEVISFRLTVRSAASMVSPSRPMPGADGSIGDGERADKKTTRSRSAGKTTAPASRSDSIDCAVWRGDLRARVQKYRVGDVLEVTGAVRHRYWRAAGGLASRYEVEVEKVRVVTKARVGKAPPTQPLTPDESPGVDAVTPDGPLALAAAPS